MKIRCIAVLAFLVFALAAPVSAQACYYEDIPLDETVQTYIWNKCDENDVSFDFMIALIENESNYDTYATSPTGDYGLCQINKSANQKLINNLGVYSLYDEESNIDVAFEILVPLFEKYDDPHSVLMAYNMGEGGAKRAWRKGIYSSQYSRKIMDLADSFTYDEAIVDDYYLFD